MIWSLLSDDPLIVKAGLFWGCVIRKVPTLVSKACNFSASSSPNSISADKTDETAVISFPFPYADVIANTVYLIIVIFTFQMVMFVILKAQKAQYDAFDW